MPDFTVNAPVKPNAQPAPAISVIVLNYNGAPWLERCLGSLRAQTIFDQLEVIVADNNSPDGSATLAAELMRDWPNGRVIQHEANLGYCEGNNRAAAHARGRYLFFLNNDTWLEPDCLEVLLSTAGRMNAQAGTPLMLNYDEDTVQSAGGAGFDLFGFMSLERPHDSPKEVFVAGGCSYLVLRDWFERLGGFDAVFYMYADEYDLSWRIWLAGGRIVSAPAARLHHRGAANETSRGHGQKLIQQTSDDKRFLSNRNTLLTILKNSQHVLLVLAGLQVLALALEAFLTLLLVRRWSFLRRAYFEALRDCWRLRAHVRAARTSIRRLRRRSDWQMLRFLRWRLNRWDELRRFARYGLPKVNQT